jgi:hypothetical protein
MFASLAASTRVPCDVDAAITEKKGLALPIFPLFQWVYVRFNAADPAGEGS